MGALVAEPQENMFSKKNLLVWFCLAPHWGPGSISPNGCTRAGSRMLPREDGGRSLILVAPRSLPRISAPPMPYQLCLHQDWRVVEPQVCFARGDLATECRDPVTVHVIVK